MKLGLALLLLTACLGRIALAEDEVNGVDLEALQSRVGAVEQMHSVDFSSARRSAT
ncbi:hypothetical protein [Pseudomonas mangrovi]|jgi:hypothetical protein|uniref:hypothetical protein n=1 Tax=Pseudomonas mangrovi TaxID=2161748 RepID=UPI001304D9B9|nr:hypothetical protein [Pseudomonas mangrovi]